jgi:hypothetical protein
MTMMMMMMMMMVLVVRVVATDILTSLQNATFRKCFSHVCVNEHTVFLKTNAHFGNKLVTYL